MSKPHYNVNVTDIETDEQKIKEFVENLYAGGRKPCESFGVTWEQLGHLEQFLWSK